jgi:hypothetical protein
MSIKQHMGKSYAFDALAQGKGLWKEITKSGKLGRIAKKELQDRWGNPNNEGQLFNNSSPAPLSGNSSNVTKMGGMIKNKVPSANRLKTFGSLLQDPNETVLSAMGKSIKQRLSPEILIKNLFGRNVGLMAAKAMGASPERIATVAGGFDDTVAKKSKTSAITSPLSSSDKAKSKPRLTADFQEEMLKELKLIRVKLYGENTIAVKFSKNSESTKDLKTIADYFKEKSKEEDVAANFRDFSKSKMPIETSSAPTAASASGESGGGLFDSIISMFTGGGAIAALAPKILSIIKKSAKALVTKVPIIGALIAAAFGLWDAYNEYMDSGDFTSAIGTFFESTIDSLTFGLASTLLGEGTIKDFVKGLVDQIGPAFEKVWEWLKEFWNEWVVTPISNMYELIKEKVSDGLDWASNVIDSTSKALKTFFTESIPNFFNENVIDPLKNVWETVKEKVGNFSITDVVSGVANTFLESATKLKNWIVDTLIKPLTSIPERLMSGIGNAMANIFDMIGGISFKFGIPDSVKSILSYIPGAGSIANAQGFEFKPFENLLALAQKLRNSGGGESGTETGGNTPGVATPTAATGGTPTAATGGTPTAATGGTPTAATGGTPTAATGGTPTAASTSMPTAPTAQVTPPAISPVPQANVPPIVASANVPQRNTGQVIQNSATELTQRQEQQQQPVAPVIAPTTINNTTVGGGGGGGNQRMAPVRTDDNSLQRINDFMALGAIP